MIPCRLCGRSSHSRELCARCRARVQAAGALERYAAPPRPFVAPATRPDVSERQRARWRDMPEEARAACVPHRPASKTTPAQRTAAARAYLRGEGALRVIGASIGVSQSRMSQIVAEELAREEAP